MIKKIFMFFVFVLVVIGLSVSANALEVDFEDEESSLGRLAGQRLYIYGIIDEIPENLGQSMSRIDAMKLIYNMVEEHDILCESLFVDTPVEYKTIVDYFYSHGVIRGYSDGLLHPYDNITQNHFLYILLRVFDPEVTFENLNSKLLELNILRVQYDFSIDDIYILICEFIDSKNLEYKAVREEIKLPKTIVVDIYSIDDGIKKLRDVFNFGPETIKINYLCDETEATKFGSLIINEFSSWTYGVGDTFFFPEVFDSNIGSRLTYMYEKIPGKEKEASDYSNYLWQQYLDREIDAPNYFHLRGLYRFIIAGDKTSAMLGHLEYERNIYVNANATNWINCLGEEFEEKTNKILYDISQFKSYSDYHKIVAVQKYIIDNAYYDYIEYLRPDEEQISEYNEYSHSILGFIESGHIVCDGYSETFHWLMNYLGVLTICQNGRVDGVEHQWNKVLLDNKWYNIDVCWNDTGFNAFEYFLKGDTAFRNTHQITHNYRHPIFKAYEDYNSSNIIFDF